MQRTTPCSSEGLTQPHVLLPVEDPVQGPLCTGGHRTLHVPLGRWNGVAAGLKRVGSRLDSQLLCVSISVRSVRAASVGEAV